MKTIRTFVSGLLLSVALLLPVSALAAELQPFAMLKVSGVNSLVNVAEKFATMAGANNTPEFREFVNTARNIKGIDANGIAAVAAAVDSDGDITYIILLPVTDLMGIDVPGQPDVIDSIRPFLTKKGNNFEINIPMSPTHIAAQKQGYLVITPEAVADQVPADAKKLFADLEKYTVGVKLDLEKVEFEALEKTIFAPLQMSVAMFGGPDASEQLDNAINVYRELFKEFSVITGGVAINSQTADVELVTTLVPRKDSAMAKTLAGVKRQPTIFGGFRGAPDSTVFSLGDSVTVAQPFTNKALMDASMKQYDPLFSGFLEMIEEEDETGEAVAAAKKGIEALKKIVDAESKRTSNDYAVSLNIDGTFLWAFDTVTLAEMRTLAAVVVDLISKRTSDVATDFGIDAKAVVEKNLKADYVTVEGFKVSSFKVPMEVLVSFAPGPNEGLKEFSPGIFWAVKEGNKQAVAVAVGLNFDKAEQSLKSALEKTKASTPVQLPEGTFSIAGLGKFLSQTIYPAAAKDGAPPDFKKVADVLASAGNDATVALSGDIKPDKVDVVYRVSGKAIQAVISAVKIGVEEQRMPPAIQNF
jgi:hypothetical protein